MDKAAAEVFGPEIASEATGRTPAVALIGLLLLAVVALSALNYWPRPQGPLPPRPASGVTAAAPLAPASSTAAPPRQVTALPVEELDVLLPQLPADIKPAWQALGSNWKLPPDDGDPCQSAKLQKFQCYRTNNLSLPQLRQLNRPGILTLQVDKAVPAYALLVGLGEQSATLRMADGLHRVRLVSLSRLWRGDFATYWQAPNDYVPDLRDGSSGGAIEQLASQLDLLEARPAPAPGSAPRVLDAALRERVRTFQRSQGLKADGQPGPMTFMQLDSSTGTNPVRLQTEAR